jgi:hypothetical protein
MHFTAMDIEPIVGLIYLAIGFIVTYLSLEVAWHFTACRIKIVGENGVKPCLFKQAKLAALATTHNIPRKSPS